MSELKLQLANGSEILCEDISADLHAVLQAESVAAVNAIWNELTPAGLAAVAVVRDGVTLGIYGGVTLTGVQAMANGDGSYTVHLYMQPETAESATAEKDALEAEYAEAGRILLGGAV